MYQGLGWPLSTHQFMYIFEGALKFKNIVFYGRVRFRRQVAFVGNLKGGHRQEC